MKLVKTIILNIIPVLMGMIFFSITEEIFNYLFPVVEDFIDDPAIVGLFMIIFPFAIFLFLLLIQYLFITEAIYKNFRRVFRVLMLVILFISLIFFLISFEEMHNFKVGIRVFSEMLFESSTYIIANLFTSKYLLKILKVE